MSIRGIRDKNLNSIIETLDKEQLKKVNRDLKGFSAGKKIQRFFANFALKVKNVFRKVVVSPWQKSSDKVDYIVKTIQNLGDKLSSKSANDIKELALKEKAISDQLDKTFGVELKPFSVDLRSYIEGEKNEKQLLEILEKRKDGFSLEDYRSGEVRAFFDAIEGLEPPSPTAMKYFLSMKNSDGYNPLMLALQADDKDLSYGILSRINSFRDSGDMKESDLISASCEIASDGNSAISLALKLAIAEKDDDILGEIEDFLSHVNIDVPNATVVNALIARSAGKKEKTPLRLAVESKNVDLVWSMVDILRWGWLYGKYPKLDKDMKKAAKFLKKHSVGEQKERAKLLLSSVQQKLKIKEGLEKEITFSAEDYASGLVLAKFNDLVAKEDMEGMLKFLKTKINGLSQFVCAVSFGESKLASEVLRMSDEEDKIWQKSEDGRLPLRMVLENYDKPGMKELAEELIDAMALDSEGKKLLDHSIYEFAATKDLGLAARIANKGR